MRHTYRSVQPNSHCIGAPVSEQSDHLRERLAVDGRTVESPDTRYSTHSGCPISTVGDGRTIVLSDAHPQRNTQVRLSALLKRALQCRVMLREVIDYRH